MTAERITAAHMSRLALAEDCAQGAFSRGQSGDPLARQSLRAALEDVAMQATELIERIDDTTRERTGS